MWSGDPQLAPHSIVLYCNALWCSVLHCIYSTKHYNAMSCNVMHCRDTKPSLTQIHPELESIDITAVYINYCISVLPCCKGLFEQHLLSRDA